MNYFIPLYFLYTRLHYNKNIKVPCREKMKLSEEELHARHYPAKKFHPNISAKHKAFWNKSKKRDRATGLLTTWSGL